SPLLLRDRAPLPALSSLRPGAPPALNALLQRCLAEPPEDRPESAAQVARTLRGEEQGLVLSAARDHTSCQACGAPLRLGQRLCLRCGREAVLFHHASPGEREPEDLVLTKVTE